MLFDFIGGPSCINYSSGYFKSDGGWIGRGSSVAGLCDFFVCFKM